MDEKTLTKYRGEVIKRFINIEAIVNLIIAQRYFRKPPGSFILEVLFDEYFSFGLKRRILEKILKKVVANLDNKKIQDLGRLSNIRNTFAHSGIEFIKDSEKAKPGITGIVPDRKTGTLEKPIDFQKQYEEFIEKYREVEKYLRKIYRDLGGSLTDQLN